MSNDTKTYSDPKLAINRVYTKKGDAGETALVGGQKVRKDAVRIEAYGTVDELLSVLGMCREEARRVLPRASAAGQAGLATLIATWTRVQHELFNLGSILATLPEDVHPQQPSVGEADIEALERDIDALTDALPPLRSFVLPGGTALTAQLHLARTVCRRAERIAVSLAAAEPVPPDAIRYLNRLSDALFVWSRHATVLLDAEELLWSPNAASSAAKV